VLDGKTGVPADLTGNDGSYVDKYVAKVLREEYWGPPYNVAVRLGPDVIGIDVDAYDAKRGAETIEEALDGAWLPETFRTSARGWDSRSGIYLYRLAEPARWPTNFGPGSGVEVIQRHHRYAMVGPSVHPGLGNPYQWLLGNSTVGIPRVVDIPVLGAAVRLKLLAYMAERGQTASDAQDWAGAEDGLAWLAGGGDGEGPCHRMSTALGVWLDKLGSAHGGTRHDTMIAAQLNLCRLRKEGHPGLHEALSTLYAEWQLVMAGESRGVVAEFGRALGRPLHEALAAAAGGEEDPCEVPEALYDSLGEDVLLEDDELSPAVPAVAKVVKERLEQKKLAAQVVTAVVVDDPMSVSQNPVSTGVVAVPPAAPAAGPVPTVSTGLPHEFWQSRGYLAHILQAARSRRRSPDAVLGVVLARVAAMLPPDVHFDFGLGRGSLNFFSLLLGAPATGKSQALAIGKALLPTTSALLGDAGFCDGEQLVSGEAVTENYWGVDKDSGQRQQVRSNAYVSYAEGNSLNKLMKRNGVTLPDLLRQAWSGEDIGQRSAHAETTRRVREGGYSMGLAAGYQLSTVQELLADVGTGMIQRFCWFSARVPAADVPAVAPSWPGALVMPTRPVGVAGAIGCSGEIAAELDANAIAASDSDDEDWQKAHADLMVCKIACLLMLLEQGEGGPQWHVGAGTWELAKEVWATSCRVRTRALEFGVEQEFQERDKDLDLATERTERALLAKNKLARNVGRVARLAVAKVGEAGGSSVSRGVLNRAIVSRDRCYLDEALNQAVLAKWLVRAGEDGYVLGSVVVDRKS